MIYIISGTSRSGKSTMAKHLFEDLNIPMLSTDVLMMGFQLGMPDLGVDHLKWAHENADIMWPVLKGMIQTLITNKEDYIFEGESFNAVHLRELLDEYPGKVKALYLGYIDISVEEKYQEIMTYSEPGDWLIAYDKKYIMGHINNMIKLSKQVQKECEEYRIPYFDTSKDFISSIEKAMEYLKK